MLVNVLIVDDHQLMISGYKSVLSFNTNFQITTTEAYDCKSAYEIITNPANSSAFELVFLDYSLPPYPEQKIQSGEDLAVLIRKFMPNTKIIMLTAHFDAIKLYNIVKRAQPNGLLVKSDFQPPQLIEVFNTVMQGNLFYSPLVSERIKERLLAQGLLDKIDQQIIVLLSEGFKNNSIATKLNISTSAIEKRKATIKDFLGIDKGTDEDILVFSRQLGLIL
jgi:DNA-binding NarL/FixJ family response regulator